MHVFGTPLYVYVLHDIEKMQKHAARWMTSDYTPHSSVTEMLKLLEWHEFYTLETRKLEVYNVH